MNIGVAGLARKRQYLRTEPGLYRESCSACWLTEGSAVWHQHKGVLSIQAYGMIGFTFGSRRVAGKLLRLGMFRRDGIASDHARAGRRFLLAASRRPDVWRGRACGKATVFLHARLDLLKALLSR